MLRYSAAASLGGAGGQRSASLRIFCVLLVLSLLTTCRLELAVSAADGAIAPKLLPTPPTCAVSAPHASPSDPGELELIPAPIPFGDDRKQLTVAYLERHHGGPFTGDLDLDTRMSPRMIVLHWTAGPSARSARNTFWRARQRPREGRSPADEVNLSAHFVVKRDGAILQLLEADRIGRHTIGLNHLAIGIENAGDRDHWPLTDAQVDANKALVRYLVARFDITHLIGHYESRRFEGHPYFRERIRWFRSRKIDPGEAFMAEVRSGVADLGLLGPP